MTYSDHACSDGLEGPRSRISTAPFTSESLNRTTIKSLFLVLTLSENVGSMTNQWLRLNLASSSIYDLNHLLEFLHRSPLPTPHSDIQTTLSSNRCWRSIPRSTTNGDHPKFWAQKGAILVILTNQVPTPIVLRDTLIVMLVRHVARDHKLLRTTPLWWTIEIS